MEMRAHLLEEIGEPVPAVTRFQYDFSVLASLLELLREGDGVVVEMDRL